MALIVRSRVVRDRLRALEAMHSGRLVVRRVDTSVLERGAGGSRKETSMRREGYAGMLKDVVSPSEVVGSPGAERG